MIAVVGFYLISGYVMAALMRRHYAGSAHALAFYQDRAWRLLPQYFLYAGLTLLWLWLSQAQTPFLSRSPTLPDLLNNLLVLPLNYYMFNASDQFTLIPPAWSLGAEMQFYLLAPFLLLWPRRLYGVGLLGLTVYLAALAGLINSDWFGYRLLPGVLLFFLLGGCRATAPAPAAPAAPRPWCGRGGAGPVGAGPGFAAPQRHTASALPL